MSLKSKTELDDLVRTREFSQARAQRTFDSLLSAAEEEFSTRGYDGTQTTDLATRAGVSVGTFYRYFQDKKEILLEVLKRDLVRGRDEALSRLTPESLVGSGRRETIDSALRVIFDNCNRNPGLQRVFIEMSLRDEDFARLRALSEADTTSRIAQLIASVCREDEVADPEATAHVILTSVVECVCVSAGARGPSPIDVDRTMAALSEMVFRAVFGGGSPSEQE